MHGPQSRQPAPIDTPGERLHAVLVPFHPRYDAGILFHEQALRSHEGLRGARQRALEYLLQRRLRYRLTPGGACRAMASDAVEAVRAARDEDGRWRQGTRFKGQVWFDDDVPVGEPPPWLTFHALRVLRWWDGAGG